MRRTYLVARDHEARVDQMRRPEDEKRLSRFVRLQDLLHPPSEERVLVAMVCLHALRPRRAYGIMYNHESVRKLDAFEACIW